MDTSEAALACYAGAEFDDKLHAAAGGDVLLADLGTIYGANDANSR